MSTSEHSAVVAPVDAEEGEFHFEYTVHKGVFMQSEDETDDTKFDFVCYSYLSLSLSLSFFRSNQSNTWTLLSSKQHVVCLN